MQSEPASNQPTRNRKNDCNYHSRYLQLVSASPRLSLGAFLSRNLLGNLCPDASLILSADLGKTARRPHLPDNFLVVILDNLSLSAMHLAVKAIGCDDESHVV